MAERDNSDPPLENEEEYIARIIGNIARKDPDTGAELVVRIARRDPHRKTPTPEASPRKEESWPGGRSDSSSTEEEGAPAPSPAALARFQQAEADAEARREKKGRPGPPRE